MDKEFLQEIVQLQIENYEGVNTLGGLLNYLTNFIDNRIEPINSDVWLFQSYLPMDTDYLMSDSKEKVFNFFSSNIESYFNFYINIEDNDIEPYGIADIWVSFKVSDESKELILNTLNKIKESLTSLPELSDMNEIIDTRLPYYSDDFLDNIIIESSKVIA